jgi:hypothetical protein
VFACAANVVASCHSVIAVDAAYVCVCVVIYVLVVTRLGSVCYIVMEQSDTLSNKISSSRLKKKKMNEEENTNRKDRAISREKIILSDKYSFHI